MKYSRFEDLPVWRVASDLFVRIDALTDHPAFSGRGDLSDQIQRSALSVSNNIAEGFEQGTTEQLITFLYHAKGSAGETRSVLRQMEHLPRFSNFKSEISDLISLCDSISRQLRGWLDNLQNSDIKGTRYLTDAAREQTDRRRRADAFLERLRQISPPRDNDAQAAG